MKFEGGFGRWFESKRNEAGHNAPG